MLTVNRQPYRLTEVDDEWPPVEPADLRAVVRRTVYVRIKSRIAFLARRSPAHRGAITADGRFRSLPKVHYLTGCSLDELIDHLERCFMPGMTWHAFLRGEIEIDHVRPVASFDLTDTLEWLRCWNPLNLRPLWAEDNRRKAARRG